MIARAGRFGKAWNETSSPSYDDVERFIRSRAAEIDAAIGGRGIPVPVSGTAAGSLRNLNAAGALILLLGATALGQSADAVSSLLERVEKEWDVGMTAIANGTHSAVVVILADDAGDGSANDFWSEEPDYGEDWWEDENDNPHIAPQFTRTEVF